MMLGVLQFSAFCASITELIIFDNSSDTAEFKSRDLMIKNIISKYNLKSGSRKSMGMLSNSLYEKRLIYE